MKRWGLTECDNGGWVLYKDHLEEIERLRAGWIQADKLGLEGRIKHVDELAEARRKALEDAAAVIRPIITEKLNLTYDQRAYSWHEMQWLIEKLEAAIRAIENTARKE